jgi:hypothetical protein
MTVSLFAAEQAPTGEVRKSEPIYGYRMMSDPERNEYRERMRNARSAEERQAVRDEHRNLMEQRAKERGVTLPERGGPGYGKGPGYGPGGGKGPGYGPGGGKGPGYGQEGSKGEGRGPGYGKGPGYGSGPGGNCPAGQECPGAGRGPAAKP